MGQWNAVAQSGVENAVLQFHGFPFGQASRFKRQR
jgi:hypothetical protein